MRGKIRINGEDVVVASDTVNIEVTVPGGGTGFEKSICISAKNSEASGYSMPLTTQVWATITEGDCDSGLPFTDYDSAVWLWNGTDNSVIIHQPDSGIPQADITVNRVGDYVLTLVVKKGESLIATASHTISFDEVEIDAGSYPDNDGDGDGDVELTFSSAPGTFNLHGTITKGEVDSVAWVFLDLNAPPNLVTFSDYTNLNTDVNFNAVDGYSGAGIYAITLLGKREIDGQDVVVASDTVNIEVTIPGDGNSFEKTLCIRTANDEASGSTMPLTTRVWATITEGDCYSGVPFTDYNSAIWSWSGAGNSVVINQIDISVPEANVTVNEPGDYTLTLVVKNGDSLIGTVSHQISFKDARVEILMGHPNCFVDSNATINLYGRVIQGDIDSVEWAFLAPDAPDGLVTFVNPTNLDAEVTFSIGGIYPITLLGKSNIGEQEVIVASDTVYFVVDGNPTFHESICVSTSNSEPNSTVLPFTLQVNAAIKSGDCEYGEDFSNYDSAVWSWSGTDGSVVISQNDQSDPQASVTFNKPGEYALTLEVKKAGSLIGIASHTITITGTEVGCNISANAGFDEDMNDKLLDIVLGSTATLFGEITNTCTTQIEYYWSCGNPSNAVDFTPVASADPCKVPVNVTFAEPGGYPFTLCVVDKQTRELLATSGTIFASVAPPLYWLDISGEQIVRWDSSSSTASSTLSATISGGAPAGSACTWSTADSNVILPNPATVDSGVQVTIGFTSLGYHDINVTGNVDNPAWSGTSTVTVYVTEEIGGIDTVIYNAGSTKYITLPDSAYMSDAAFITNNPNYLVPRWSLGSGPSGAEVSFLPNENSEKPYVAFSKPGQYKLKLVPWNLYTQGQIPDTNTDTVDVFVSVPVIQNPDAPEVTLQVEDISKLLTATANDEDGVMQLQIELGDDGDSIVLERASGAPVYNQTLMLQYTLDVSSLPSGTSSIRARAWDISGNMSQSTPDMHFTSNSDVNYFHVTPETINTLTGDTLTYAAEFSGVKMWTVDIYRQGEGEVDTNEGTDVNFEKTINTTGWPDGDYSAVLKIGYETPEDETDDEAREVRFRILRGQVSRSDVIAELLRFENTDIANGLGEIPREADYRPPILVIREGRGNIYANIGSNKFPNDVEYRLLICTGGSGNTLVPIQIITPSDVPHNSQGWARKVSDGNTVEDLGTIDLSMLENGSYYMLLSVRCNGVIRDDSAQFILDCPLKIGNVKFSQEDLVVETGGIPLRVVRTYDSLRKHKQGEFGYGWTYSIANLDITLDETRMPMYSSTLIDYRYDWTIPTRVGDNITNRNVTLTLPDGRRTTFMFYLKFHGVNPLNGGLPYYTAEYAPMDGIDAELIAKAYNSNIDIWNKKEVLCGNIIGDKSAYWEAVGLNGDSVTAQHVDASMYDFYSYILKTGDGTEYYFERDLKSKNYYGVADYMCPPGGNPALDVYYTIVRGPLYLTRIKAKNGEEIVLNTNLATGRIGAAGIEFKDAQGTPSSRKLKVGYDGSGRISYIDAPSEANTGTHTLIYEYDVENGNLTQVKKLVSKNPVKYDVTDYVYEDSTHEPADHFVTDIKDDRGLTPIRYVYDAAGRLTETIDAKGNHITINHNVTGKVETVYERWDTEKHYPTTYSYNDRGNVELIQKNEVGNSNPLEKTEYVYDAGSDNPREIRKSVPNPDNPSQEVTAVTYYEYDQYGKPTLTADPENNVTKTTYDRFGNVIEVIQGMNYNQSNGNYTAVSRTANTYEGSNLKTASVWDPNNNNKPMSMSVNVYDSRNRLVSSANIDVEAMSTEDFQVLYNLQNIANLPHSDKHSITTYGYNGNELQPQSVQDPAGAVTHFAYDENGRQLYSYYFWDAPEGSQDLYVYNLTDYDDAGRVVATRRIIDNDLPYDLADQDYDSQVNLSQTQYNSLGKVYFTIDQSNNVTKYEYDQSGNLVETRNYDSNNTLLTVSRTLYDAENRTIVSVGPYNPNDSNSVGTENVYDVQGRVVETRRWVDVKINLVPFKVSAGGQAIPCAADDPYMVGKMVPVGVIPKNAWNETGTPSAVNSLCWTSEDKLPVALSSIGTDQIGPLSYTRTVYDIAGRVKHSLTLDKNGDEQPTTYLYDKAGKQTAVIDPLGHNISDLYVNYIAIYDGTIVSRKINFDSPNFNENQDLSQTIRTTTVYEGTQRKSISDAHVNITEFIYDAIGRITTTKHSPTEFDGSTGAQNTYIHVGYDGLGRKNWQSDTTKHTGQTGDEVPASQIRDFDYDAAGRLIATTLTDPQVESGTNQPKYRYIYDERGNQVGILDARNQLTVSEYDEFGNQIAKYMPFVSTNPAPADINTSAEVYTALANASPAPKAEYWDYNTLGRLDAHTDYIEQTTGYFYNNRGQLYYKRFYAYDGTLDGTNNNYAQNLWAKQVEYTYDNLGRRIQVTETDNPLTYTRTTTYVYDAEGRIKSVTSPEGTVNYTYDSITGQKVNTSTAYGSTAGNTNTNYSYDELGRLSEVQTGTKSATYHYDAVGNRDYTELDLDGTAGYEIKTVYTYNQMNRLTDLVQQKTGAISLASYHYILKANGNRHSLAESLNETRNVTYGYDNLNRLTGETASESTNGYISTYEYDLAGNRTKRVVTVNNNQPFTTEYDYYEGTDKLHTETHCGASCVMDIGKERYYAYANTYGDFYYRDSSGKTIGSLQAFFMGLPSVWSRYIFILALVLLPVLMFGPGLLRLVNRYVLRNMIPVRLHVPRKGICLLVAFVMLFGPENFQQFSQAEMQYANLGASSWGEVDRTIEYTYDANGSVESKTTKITSTQVVQETVDYDYNLENRFQTVTITRGSTVEVTTYTYNDDGIRVKSEFIRTISGVNDEVRDTMYLVDSDNHTGYAQTLEEKTETTEYISGVAQPLVTETTAYLIGDDVLAQTKGGNTQYLLYDGHGNTRQLAEYSGSAVSIVNNYSYDGYGVLLQNDSVVSNDPGKVAPQATNLLYAGEHFDTDSQQYYLRARWYDSLNGRFNQLDPYAGNNEDPQSLHKYLYCHANPANNVDFSGLSIYDESGGYPYNLHTGIMAHAIFYVLASLKGGFYDTPVGQLISGDLVGAGLALLRPDAVIKKGSKKGFYELKPITNKSNTSLAQRVDIQMKLYDLAFRRSSIGRGDSARFLGVLDGTTVGFLKYGGSWYLVRFYAATESFRSVVGNYEGLIYYSLTKIDYNPPRGGKELLRPIAVPEDVKENIRIPSLAPIAITTANFKINQMVMTSALIIAGGIGVTIAVSSLSGRYAL